ncbi:MAG: hypothetical protein WBM13_01100 [Bacteroidia bacterium]
MKKTIKSISFITIITLLASCGSSEKNSTTEVVSDSVKTAENTTDSTETEQASVLYNIPSPIETFTVLKMTGAKFDKSLLNAANNITKYNSSYSKAINLGTYSADLSFCLLYKQNQDINIYLKNVNELTSALDIDGSYVQTTAQRLKVNANNLDSIMLIVSEATVNANLYLKENQRDNVTALVTTGGWVEGMYFLTNLASKTNKKEILDLVADQKNVVKNLVKALEQFSAENQEIAALLKDVKEIEAIYNSLAPVQNVAVASTDNDIVSIGNNSAIELTKEQLKSILDKVTALRSKLTA